MYQLTYNMITGKVAGLIKNGSAIPLCEANTDYQDFLKWNSEQLKPLDLNSTIEVVKPEPARDLAKELDELKAQVVANTEKLAVIEVKPIAE